MFFVKSISNLPSALMPVSLTLAIETEIAKSLEKYAKTLVFIRKKFISEPRSSRIFQTSTSAKCNSNGRAIVRKIIIK